jgi:hypothetical protein
MSLLRLLILGESKDVQTALELGVIAASREGE